jgi:hypothetical protein
MKNIELRVRDLRTGDTSIVGFDSEEIALAWLMERPRYTDVLGPARLDLPADVGGRLRCALRPLDEEEKKLERALDDAAAEAARKRNEEQRARELAARDAHRAAMKDADPNRVMEVHWMYNREMELTDHADERPITGEAREAVLAWVRERDEWVRDRGQVVGDAKVTVWPGPLPASACGERVKHGSFIPITAPAKEAANADARPTSKSD